MSSPTCGWTGRRTGRSTTTPPRCSSLSTPPPLLVPRRHHQHSKAGAEELLDAPEVFCYFLKERLHKITQFFSNFLKVTTTVAPTPACSGFARPPTPRSLRTTLHTPMPTFTWCTRTITTACTSAARSASRSWLKEKTGSISVI